MFLCVRMLRMNVLDILEKKKKYEFKKKKKKIYRIKTINRSSSSCTKENMMPSDTHTDWRERERSNDHRERNKKKNAL